MNDCTDGAPELSFLAGGGEMGRRMRSFDWHNSPMGDAMRWAPSLKAMVRLVLATQHPMAILWGPLHVLLFNDAFSCSLGPEQHPGLLGQPGQQAWAEIWDRIGPHIACVMRGDEACWRDDQQIPFVRHGALEEVYWTCSYDPIDDPTAPSGVGGVLVMCIEAIQQARAKRRQVAGWAGAPHEQFAHLFERTPTFMAVLCGTEHRIEQTNPGFRRLVGDRDTRGMTVAQALPDAVSQGYLARLDQVFRTGEAYTAEGARIVVGSMPGEPGRERFVDFVFQPILDAAGAVTSIFVEGVDMTDRARVNEALRRSEEQLRLAIEAAEVGFWDVDPVSDTLVWPPRVKAMFGISADKPVSMADFYAGLHPLDAAHVGVAYTEAVDPALRALYDVEYRTIGKEDGVIRWVAAKGRGRFDEAGRCVRVIGTAIDITKRKAIEAQVQELNETLEAQVRERTRALMETEEQLRQAQKMEAVGQLTGGIAHDFNNLLQGVAGSLDLIRRKPGDASRVQRWAESGLQAAERGAKLTSQLLAFSRAQKLESKPVVVTDLIEGMRDLLDRTLGHTVTVRLALDRSRLVALCDPTQLEMSVLNLAINARDAMPEGGELVIASRPCTLRDDPELPAGDYVEIVVSDTGRGMAPEVTARAFDPFFTTKGIGKGTGLGLSQVYASTRQAGGVARIDSTEGRGTTVRLLMQRVAQALPVSDAGDARPAAPINSAATVLVVDDDADVRRFLLDSLQALGFAVLEAADGYAALAMLERARPDLLLIDFAMPGLNGAEVAQAARRSCPDLPIVFASGYADTIAIETLAGRSAPVLRKPFRIAELHAVLALALDRSGADLPR